MDGLATGVFDMRSKEGIDLPGFVGKAFSKG